MPKQTYKYVSACAVARAADINQDNFTNREELYAALNAHSWHWNSKTKCWDNYAAIPADHPSPVIRVRVWASAETVAAVAEAVVRSLTDDGLTLVNQSNPYPCRPPAHRESRIYLDFMAESNQSTSPVPKPGDAVLGTQSQ